jgi:hypothetical protein
MSKDRSCIIAGNRRRHCFHWYKRLSSPSAAHGSFPIRSPFAGTHQKHIVPKPTTASPPSLLHGHHLPTHSVLFAHFLLSGLFFALTSLASLSCSPLSTPLSASSHCRTPVLAETTPSSLFDLTATPRHQISRIRLSWRLLLRRMAPWSRG